MNAVQLSLFEVDQRPPVLKVKRGTMARIKRATGITYPTIKAALQFKTKTNRARLIRAWALNEGGQVTQTPNYESRMACRGFIWNENDVCTNPKVSHFWQLKKNTFFKILVAQRPDGRWAWGIETLIHECGSFFGPSLYDRTAPARETECDAVAAAVIYLEKMRARDIACGHPKLPAFNKEIKRIKEQYNIQ